MIHWEAIERIRASERESQSKSEAVTKLDAKDSWKQYNLISFDHWCCGIPWCTGRLSDWALLMFIRLQTTTLILNTRSSAPNPMCRPYTRRAARPPAAADRLVCIRYPFGSFGVVHRNSGIDMNRIDFCDLKCHSAARHHRDLATNENM